MELDRVLKKIIYESEINQTELAALLGCSQVSISRIRRNLQFPSTILLLKIIKLAKRYNISVELEELLPLKTFKDEAYERRRKVRKHETK